MGLEPKTSHRYSGTKPILSSEDGQYDLEINPGVDKKPHSVVKTDRQGSILPPL